MRTRKSKNGRKKPQREGCAIGEAYRNARERAREHAWTAVQHLRLIQHGAHIPKLYQKFFPEEFARDVPNYGDGRELMKYYDRFARLVDAQLFPVWEFTENDLAYDEPEYILHRMQVGLVDNWLWINREELRNTEDLHIVEKLVVSAFNKEKVFSDVDFRLPAGHVFRTELLDLACEEEKGMISRLGLMTAAIVGDTGNCWLDVSDEEYHMAESPEWTEEQVQYLADKFAESKRMKKEIQEFLRWADSPGKIERVKRLLRGCWVREDEPVRVKEKPAPTLVESLGGLL
jgi:hypothetical protein